MWLFTRYGFFSVVQVPGGHLMQIRARNPEHLRLLREDFRYLRRQAIIRTPRADYGFRIVVRRTTVVRLAAELAVQIEWPNFKNEALVGYEGADAYIDALHEVWAVMRRTQRPASV